MQKTKSTDLPSIYMIVLNFGIKLDCFKGIETSLFTSTAYEGVCSLYTYAYNSQVIWSKLYLREISVGVNFWLGLKQQYWSR